MKILFVQIVAAIPGDEDESWEECIRVLSQFSE
jgi:hypothetical protein